MRRSMFPSVTLSTLRLKSSIFNSYACIFCTSSSGRNGSITLDRVGPHLVELASHTYVRLIVFAAVTRLLQLRTALRIYCCGSYVTR
jgi:hypothetical protein